MTNTLTWDLKPIALPKVNSNLLSVVSLILLLTMAFMTASVVAEDCADKKEAADEAAEDWAFATTVWSIATAAAGLACAGARKSKNSYVAAGCLLAIGVAATAAWDMARKSEAYEKAAREYLECLEGNGNDGSDASGSSTSS